MRSLVRGAFYFLAIVCIFIVACAVLIAIPRSATGACRIVGDHEFNDGHCIPYCPPRPSECG